RRSMTSRTACPHDARKLSRKVQRSPAGKMRAGPLPRVRRRAELGPHIDQQPVCDLPQRHRSALNTELERLPSTRRGGGEERSVVTALERGAANGKYREVQQDKEHTMKWITREKVKVDRVACPWLIKKFVDPQAEFLFVPTDQVTAVAAREGAIPYD